MSPHLATTTNIYSTDKTHTPRKNLTGTKQLTTKLCFIFQPPKHTLLKHRSCPLACAFNITHYYRHGSIISQDPSSLDGTTIKKTLSTYCSVALLFLLIDVHTATIYYLWPRLVDMVSFQSAAGNLIRIGGTLRAGRQGIGS